MASDRYTTRSKGGTLLAVLLTIVAAFALRETASVTLPLAFAIFLVALHWPLQRRLQEHVPKGIAVILTLIVFATVVGGFVWALLESADEVKDSAGKYSGELNQTVEGTKAWLAQRGIDIEATGGGALQSVAKSLSRSLFDFVGGAVLVIAFLGLGLLEVRDFKAKLNRIVARGPDDVHWSNVLRRIGTQFQRYVVVRTGIGALTGVGCGAGALIIGLDFWYIWGILNFLLNYIPTLGSIIGVIPPVLFAWFQFGDPMMVLLTLAVVGGVQLVMGNWIDPLVQGKYLQLSPLVVLLSVTFWAWVWGIPGALIGVPLTIGAVLVAREFDSTRWIAVVLAGPPDVAEGEVDDAERHEESAGGTGPEAIGPRRHQPDS